jgi:hypothetical protein
MLKHQYHQTLCCLLSLLEQESAGRGFLCATVARIICILRPRLTLFWFTDSNVKSEGKLRMENIPQSFGRRFYYEHSFIHSSQHNRQRSNFKYISSIYYGIFLLCKLRFSMELRIY